MVQFSSTDYIIHLSGLLMTKSLQETILFP